MSHLLIVCPLKKELTYLLEGFTKAGWVFESRSTNKLSLTHSPEQKVTLAIGGHGKVQFAIQTQYLLTQLPDVTRVICVGAAGALSDKVKIGDLVLAEKTIEHDYTEKFDAEAKLPHFLGHSDFLKKALTITASLPYSYHIGTIASGDEDIIDPIRATELYKKTNALAVAWEGVGGARACKFHGIPYLELRAITDNARDSVSESFFKNLQQCMYNAADFIDKLEETHP